MVRGRQMSRMKALRWILMWILIGVRLQMVEAAEEEIPARREMERALETALVPRVGNMARWRKMTPVTKEGEQVNSGKKEKKYKQPRQGPKDLPRTQPGKGPSTPERNSQGKDPSVFKDPVKKVARSRKAEGREVQEEEEKQGEKGEAQKKEMAEEVQNSHHKSVHHESEERQKGEGKQKK